MIEEIPIPVQDMVTHNFPLEEIQPGSNTAAGKTTGSIQVQNEQSSLDRKRGVTEVGFWG